MYTTSYNRQETFTMKSIYLLFFTMFFYISALTASEIKSSFPEIHTSGITETSKSIGKKKKKKKKKKENTPTTSPKNNPSVKAKVKKISHIVIDNNNVAEIESRGINSHDKNITEIESQWKSELYNSDLFETLQNDVRSYSNEKVLFESLPTDLLMERLQEMDSKTPFHLEYNPILENIIKKYLKYRSSSMKRLIALSAYYFPLFEQELDRFDIPLELKYLAIVESALKPNAKSHVGATGLWQFMYPTGKMFGLDVDSYVDERMDPLKATVAACKYLSSLHKTFGDWNLALAAYNSGPGNVMKAIRRSGGSKNYWNIRHLLPKETAGYVPAFIANMYLFEYAVEHGIQPDRPRIVFFETDTVKIRKKVTLKEVAQVLEMDIKEVTFLNPSYKVGVIPSSKKDTYNLRLPIDKIGKYVSHEYDIYELAKKREDELEKSMYHDMATKKKFQYKVQKGDYLGLLAKRFKTTSTNIKKWNNLRYNMLKIGQSLTIYSGLRDDVMVAK